MATPLINGQSYSWSQINFIILGVPVVGVRAVEYKETQDMENIYGVGSQPVARGYGNVSYEASITLLSEEVERLADVAPNGRLQEIPEFDIPITFLPDSGVIQSHVLKACRFTENSRSVNQGDKTIEVQIPLIIGQINWKG